MVIKISNKEQRLRISKALACNLLKPLQLILSLAVPNFKSQSEVKQTENTLLDATFYNVLINAHAKLTCTRIEKCKGEIASLLLTLGRHIMAQ